ncbi:MAG TPA: 30S ribosome-binding factor RbfA [Candidatus Marinimicrobia bacterium]|nr:30S ribosome-binding factor RbfA [Candidatus Neomarinimicrobiota bacterium]HJM69905.1 30S ribosome-binding factor RbfA [Candidatus Neomarinimicrobiota bacterium]
MTNEKPYKRTERVSLQIQQILGEITTKHIDISHLGFITFTRVEISPDLRHSKVFYSVLNENMSVDDINIELNNLAKAFRKYLGHEIRLKNIPDLKFFQDKSIKHEEHMQSIFKKLNTDKS